LSPVKVLLNVIKARASLINLYLNLPSHEIQLFRSFIDVHGVILNRGIESFIGLNYTILKTQKNTFYVNSLWFHN